MHRLTYMVGKDPRPPNRYIQRCCGSWGWRAKQHIDPADGNCTPSGFKEYDKHANGFARKSSRSSLVGHWLIREPATGHRALRSRERTAIRHLLSSIIPATKSRCVSCRRRPTCRWNPSLTVSMRVKGDHSARFCDHMPLYVNSEQLLWYPLWMTAAG